MPCRIVLVDDHAVVREGLRRVLEGQRDIQVVGEAGNGHDALRMVRALSPDIAVIDLSMPGIDGIEFTRLLSKEQPKTKILIFTMHANADYALRLLQAGARGFVGKGVPGTELITAILKVANGGSYLQSTLLENLPEKVAAGTSEGPPVQALSDRELQVLKLLAEGRSGRQIGEVLHLSVKTVDTYRARLLSKLRLQTTSDLIRFALRHGVIENAW